MLLSKVKSIARIAYVMISVLLITQICYAAESAVTQINEPEWTLENYGQKGSGKVSVDGDIITMTTTNTYNVWETSDEFTFYSQSQTYKKGSYGIADVKILSIDGEGLHQNASAGLMMRDGSQNGAKNVMWRITKLGKLVFTYRDIENQKTSHINGPEIGFPAELRLVRDSNNFSAYYKQNNQWILLKTFQVNMNENMLVGVGAFTVDDKTLTALFKDYNYFEGSYSDVTAVKPSEWVLNNFGDKASGEAKRDGKNIYLSTSNTFGAAEKNDSLTYYSQEFICSDTQNNSAVVTIDGIETQKTNENACAGIMFREDNTEDAKNVMFLISLNGTISLSARTEQGGATTYKLGDMLRFPATLKLDRFGNVFSAYYQVDGKWKHFDDMEVAMDAVVFAGLSVCSFGEQSTSAAFSNYSIAYEEKVTDFGDGLKLKTYGSTGKGSIATNGKSYDITSSGTAGAWGEADATTYLYKERSFPYDQCSVATATVTIDKFTNENGLVNDGHGIMMRSSDSENAAEVCIVLRSNYQVYIFYRKSDGTTTSYTTSNITQALPLELKLVRKGDSFSGFVKMDDDWKQIGNTVSASLGTDMLVGMCTWSAGSKPSVVTFANWNLDYTENYIPPEENFVDNEPVSGDILFRDNFHDGSLTNGPASIINPIWPGVKYAYLPRDKDGTRYWRFEGTQSFNIGDPKWTDYEYSMDFSFDPDKKSATNKVEVAVRVKSNPIYNEKKYMAILQNSQVQFHDNSPNWMYYKESFNYTDGNMHNIRVRALDNKISLYVDGTFKYEYIPANSPRCFGGVSLSFENCFINIYKVEIKKIEDPINGEKDNFLGYGFDEVLEDYHFKWIK